MHGGISHQPRGAECVRLGERKLVATRAVDADLRNLAKNMHRLS